MNEDSDDRKAVIGKKCRPLRAAEDAGGSG
jgi:hypothetical protein